MSYLPKLRIKNRFNEFVKSHKIRQFWDGHGVLSELSIRSDSILWLEHVDVTKPHNQALLSKSCRYYREGESADSRLVHMNLRHTCLFPAKTHVDYIK